MALLGDIFTLSTLIFLASFAEGSLIACDYVEGSPLLSSASFSELLYSHLDLTRGNCTLEEVLIVMSAEQDYTSVPLTLLDATTGK